MTFIITLISLIIERFFHWSHLRHWRWFQGYQRWLGGRIGNWPSYLLLILCVVPLLIVVGVMNCLLSGWLYDTLKLVFGIIVLMYCLGPDNLWLQVYSCITELHREDPQIVVSHVQAAFKIAPPEHSQAFHLAFTRAIFVEAYERVFAIVFWFVLLGPVGAVLYRTVSLCAKESPLGITRAATKTKNVLDWLPVRLFTFLFALGGHFKEVFAIWKRCFTKSFNTPCSLVADCGVAALAVMEANHIPEEGSAEKEALSLLDRVFVFGLVILAVGVLLT